MATRWAEGLDFDHVGLDAFLYEMKSLGLRECV